MTTSHAVSDREVTRVWSDLAGTPAAVLVTNRGSATAVIGDDPAGVDHLTGYPLGPGSSIQWDAGRRLYARCAPGDTTRIECLENSGSIFDAGAIAGQILEQGLAGAIAAQIALTGAPPIDRPVPLVSVEAPQDGTVSQWGPVDCSALGGVQWRLRGVDPATVSVPTDTIRLGFYWYDETLTQLMAVDYLHVLGDNGLTPVVTPPPDGGGGGTGGVPPTPDGAAAIVLLMMGG